MRLYNKGILIGEDRLQIEALFVEMKLQTSIRAGNRS